MQEIDHVQKISSLLNETIFANEESQKAKAEDRIKKDLISLLSQD